MTPQKFNQLGPRVPHVTAWGLGAAGYVRPGGQHHSTRPFPGPLEHRAAGRQRGTLATVVDLALTSCPALDRLPRDRPAAQLRPQHRNDLETAA